MKKTTQFVYTVLDNAICDELNCLISAVEKNMESGAYKAALIQKGIDCIKKQREQGTLKCSKFLKYPRLTALFNVYDNRITAAEWDAYISQWLSHKDPLSILVSCKDELSVEDIFQTNMIRSRLKSFHKLALVFMTMVRRLNKLEASHEKRYSARRSLQTARLKLYEKEKSNEKADADIYRIIIKHEKKDLAPDYSEKRALASMKAWHHRMVKQKKIIGANPYNSHKAKK